MTEFGLPQDEHENFQNCEQIYVKEPGEEPTNW